MIPNFYLELLPDPVLLFSVPMEYKQCIVGYLLPILMDNTKFFNISNAEKEFSLFLSKSVHTDQIRELPYVHRIDDEFSVLRIYQDTHGINEHGVVYNISKHFFEKSIPIIYVNSFSNNYILVPSKHLDELHDWIEV